jgi:hypothetical protein
LIWLSAGLLALALSGPAPDFPAGTLELKPAAILKPPFADPRLEPVDLSRPDYAFDSDVDSGLMWASTATLSAVSEGRTVAIFGNKAQAAGVFDDLDYRCALILSRDGKNGWLVDRLENTAVRWEGSTLPEWCSE